jgi:cytochrome c oxidase subunit IV
MNREIRRMLPTWILVWVLLMGLVVATYAASMSSIPAVWKTVIQFTIVIIQVGLIGILFMNLRAARGLLRFAAVAGFYWLVIMFVLTFNDYESRPLTTPCSTPAFTAAKPYLCNTQVK